MDEENRWILRGGLHRLRSRRSTSTWRRFCDCWDQQKLAKAGLQFLNTKPEAKRRKATVFTFSYSLTSHLFYRVWSVYECFLYCFPFISYHFITFPSHFVFGLIVFKQKSLRSTGWRCRRRSSGTHATWTRQPRANCRSQKAEKRSESEVNIKWKRMKKRCFQCLKPTN